MARGSNGKVMRGGAKEASGINNNSEIKRAAISAVLSQRQENVMAANINGNGGKHQARGAAYRRHVWRAAYQNRQKQARRKWRHRQQRRSAVARQKAPDIVMAYRSRGSRAVTHSGIGARRIKRRK